MDIIRRNTDYALRAMVNLAEHYKKQPLSTKTISTEDGVSYQLACKLMQKLHNARLVRSYMGPKGGFQLSRDPSRISLLEVIEAMQGPIGLNRCLLNLAACPRQPDCPVSKKLAKLQKYMSNYLGSVTLDELSRRRSMKGKGKVNISNPKRRRR